MPKRAPHRSRWSSSAPMTMSRSEAFLQKQLAALAVGQGHVVGPIAVGVHGDAGLDELDGGGAAVPLLEIADVAGVVEVGVRADDAPQTQAVVIDEMESDRSGPAWRSRCQ